MLRTFVHLLAVVNFVAIIYFQLFGRILDPKDLELYPHLGFDKFGGPWKYLTFWNLWVQLFYFAICLTKDVFIGRRSEGQKVSWESFIYATMAFPFGIFVAVLFWSIYLVDRNLVFPPVLDKYIPPIANHMMHTFMVPFLIFDTWTAKHTYPKRAVGMLTTCTGCLIYLSWTLVVAHVGGFWIYPILGHLSLVPRTLFILGTSAFGAALYWSGEKINAKIWGSTSEKEIAGIGEKRALPRSKKGKRKYY